jgi:hypothetical protein
MDTIDEQGDPMFNVLIFCLKLSIYAGALLTVVICALIGPEIAIALGLPDLLEGFAYGLGTAIGIFAASMFFGIPIVLLKINTNIERSLVLLSAIQDAMRAPRQDGRSSLLNAVAPIFVDHALDSLESD